MHVHVCAFGYAYCTHSCTHTAQDGPLVTCVGVYHTHFPIHLRTNKFTYASYVYLYTSQPWIWSIRHFCRACPLIQCAFNRTTCPTHPKPLKSRLFRAWRFVFGVPRSFLFLSEICDISSLLLTDNDRPNRRSLHAYTPYIRVCPSRLRCAGCRRCLHLFVA